MMGVDLLHPFNERSCILVFITQCVEYREPDIGIRQVRPLTHGRAIRHLRLIKTAQLSQTGATSEMNDGEKGILGRQTDGPIE